MACGSGAWRIFAALPKALPSVWRPNVVADTQPLHWRADDEAIRGPSVETMARHARCARQRVQEAAAALAADVGKADTHSPAPQLMACNPAQHSCVVVDVSASPEHDGSTVDLTSTNALKALDSKKKQ